MSNGTVTMEVALKALGIGWGDEVIVPALTFSATAYAPIAAGALPVFVDVTEATWTIDPDAVEAAVTPRTRAIMPVHLGHQMADMDRIMAIASAHDLAVVEDCAHAHGQRWNDVGAGCIGAFGSFSHQSSKILTAGEGGSLLTTTTGSRGSPIRSSIAAGPRTTPSGSTRSAPTTGSASCTQRCSRSPSTGSPASRRARAELGAALPGPGGHGPRRARDAAGSPITRWNFYRYVVAIDPDAFAGRTHGAVCDALEAEGVGAWTGYEPMSRYDLFQPALSRLPVTVEHAARLDPRGCRSRWPRRRASAKRSTSTRHVFRSDEDGVAQAVEAIAKIQRHADELPEG